MTKAGYEHLKGRTFTPPSSATWVDEFNQMLNEIPGMSRNKLTSDLIADGLKYRQLLDALATSKELSIEDIEGLITKSEVKKTKIEPMVQKISGDMLSGKDEKDDSNKEMRPVLQKESGDQRQDETQKPDKVTVPSSGVLDKLRKKKKGNELKGS